MFSIKVSNLAAFEAKLASAINLKRAQLAEKVKALAGDALYYAASTSPQYSGTFAGNWRLSVGTPNPGRDTKPHQFYPLAGPEQEGSGVAIGRAVGGSVSALAGYKFGQSIFLSTTASDQETGTEYSWDIEGNAINFRPVNPSRGRVVARTKDHAARFARQNFRGSR